MSEEFDPYRKWLGIAPHEQPAHHYRLLGIAPFEDDPDVIENAADRQMAHLRTFQSGKHGPLSQKILNELSAAKGTLLDRGRKAIYDAELQDRLYAAEAPLPPDLPPPGPMLPGSIPTAAAAPLPPSPPGYPAPIAPSAVPIPRRDLAASSAPLPVGQAVGATAAESPAMPSMGRSRGASARVRGRKSQNIVPMVMGLVAVGALLVMLLVFVVAQTSGTSEDETIPKTKTNVAAHDASKSSTNQGTTKKKTSDKAGDKTEKPKSHTEKPETKSDPDRIAQPKVDPSKPPEEMTPEEKFKLVLERAREHLGRREIEKAKKDLDDADFMKVDDDIKDEAKRLRALYEHYSAFWDAVREGIYKKMKVGDVVTFRGEELELIDRQGELVKFKFNGKEREEQINKLSPPVAVAFARKGLDIKQAKSLVIIGSFLALDGQQAKPARREKAKEYWVEAAELGEKDAALAKELELDEAFVTSVTLKPANKDDERLPKPKIDPKSPDDKPDPNMKPTETVSGPRGPIPSAEELKSAKERFKLRYAEPLAKARSKPEEQETLLGILSDDAAKEKDAALQYLIYEQACDLAVDVAKVESLVQLIDAMAERWEIDAMRQKQTLLTRSKPVSAPALESMVAACEKLLAEAEAAPRLDQAIAFGKLALKAADKIKGKDLKPLQLKIRELEAYQDASDKARAAEESLAKDDTDAAAHLNLGRFLCFYKGDWNAGLKHLTQGNIEEEKLLATDDLAASTDAVTQGQLADRWYQLAKKKAGVPRAACLKRANEWLEKALPQLSGDAKSAAEKLQRELAKELMPAMT